MNNNDIVPGFDDEKNDGLKIRLQTIDDIPSGLVLYLSGYIDTYNCNWFQKQVARVIESGFIRLVFNLAGYNMVSSVDIGSFAAFLKALKSRGGDLVIVEMQPLVYEIWRVLDFSRVFNIMDKLDDAISILKQSGPFPKKFRCPICDKWLEAIQPGSLCCLECKTVLTINKDGYVFLDALK